LKRLGIDNENIKRSEKVQNYTDAANDKIATDAQTANDKASAARQTANDKSQAENEKNSEDIKPFLKKLSTELQDLEDDSEDKKVAKKETKRFR
jgi:PAB1-binding protein PBP1